MTKRGKPKAKAESKRPSFMEALSRTYGERRRNVVLLSGDIDGPFWDRASGGFVSLERLLYSELVPKFHLLRVDIGEGITFFDEQTRREVMRICESPDGRRGPLSRQQNFERFIDETMHQPLVAIRVLRAITEAFQREREAGTGTRPVCTIIQYAGSLFPAGDFGRLDQLDRQRLVLFLDWITSSTIADGLELILLIAETRAEVNEKIILRPNAEHVEIPLPDEEERAHLVRMFTRAHKGIRFKGGQKGRQNFTEDSAGLSLANLQDILGVAHRTGQWITREHVLAEVNEFL